VKGGQSRDRKRLGGGGEGENFDGSPRKGKNNRKFLTMG